MEDNLGFPDYPNLHLDREATWSIAEWPDERLNNKISQYREFGRRTGILRHHVVRGREISQRLEFEGDYRDGVHELLGELATGLQKLEDSICDQN